MRMHLVDCCTSPPSSSYALLSGGPTRSLCRGHQNALSKVHSRPATDVCLHDGAGQVTRPWQTSGTNTTQPCPTCSTECVNAQCQRCYSNVEEFTISLILPNALYAGGRHHPNRARKGVVCMHTGIHRTSIAHPSHVHLIFRTLIMHASCSP